MKSALPLIALAILTTLSKAHADDRNQNETKLHTDWQPRVIDIDAEDNNILMGFLATFDDGTDTDPQTYSRLGLNFAGHDFVNGSETLTWTVNVPQDADYRVLAMYEKPPKINAPAALVISSNGFRMSTPTLTAKIPDGPGRLRLRRDTLNGLIPLKKGENQIVMTMEVAEEDISSKAAIFKAFSIELVQPRAWSKLLHRAEKLRSSVDWMVEGKYGLFTHWSPLSYPMHGDIRAQDNYQWGVDNFDVEAYTEMVVETGAAWVVFTTAHGPQYWPGPNKTIDSIIPGRTSKRDLIMEIADALAERNIRLALYYHHGRGDREWMEASGMLDEIPTRWYDTVVAIHQETSKRYGKKLWGSGLYVDGSANVYYQYAFPFERLARATKVGNSQAIVGFSFDRAPTCTPFTDIFVMDGYHTLAPSLPDAWFDKGGPYDGVPRAWFPFMDEWISREPLNGKLPDPVHTTEEYITYFKEMAEAKIPVTMNLVITQDVTRGQDFVNPKSLEIMRKVRKAIRGK